MNSHMGYTALSAPHSCRCGSSAPPLGFCIVPYTPGALSFLLPSGPLSFFEFPCPSNRGRFIAKFLDVTEHNSFEEAILDWSEEPEELQLFLERNGYSVKQRIIRALSSSLVQRFP